MFNTSNLPKSVIGPDRVLRSVAPPPDLSTVPSMSEGVAGFVLEEAERQVADGRDRVVMINADLALKDQTSDELGYRTQTVSTMARKGRLAGRAFHWVLGVRPGDYVSVYLPNTTEYHCHAFGALLCGATVAPGDPTLTEKVLTAQMSQLRPRVAVCWSGNRQRVEAAIRESGLEEKTKIVVLSLTDKSEDRGNNVYNTAALLEEAEGLEDPPAEADAFDAKAVSIVLWSSGTTGRPKAIQLPNRNMAYWFRKGTALKTEYLQTTCFFHGGGYMTPINCVMGGGSTRFFPVEALEGNDCCEKLLRAVDLLKPTCLVGGSHHVTRLLSAPADLSADLDTSSVVTVMPMGTGIPPDSHERLAATHLPGLKTCVNLYGQSEFGNVIAMSTTPRNLGPVYAGTEVKIVDLDTGEALGPDRVGEIMARSVHGLYMKVYLNRREEDAKFFAADGFVHTGDLGKYDEDGILHYCGRMKEIIKYQNGHVSPADVEEVVLRAVEAVGEVAAFAVPSEQDQEHVALAVVLKPGSETTAEDIRRAVEAELEPSKHVRGGVHFVKELPRNPQGKVQRRRLTEMLAK